MAQLWTVHQSRKVRRQQEPGLSVKSRFGASVLHDGLWTWREEIGGQRGPPSGSSQPAENSTQLISSTSPATLLQPPQPMASKLCILLHNKAHTNAVGNLEYSPANDGQVLRELEQPSTLETDLNNLTNVAADISDLDWDWGFGFPSLLPIDIDC